LVLGVTVGIFYFAFTKLEKQTAKYLDDLSFREDRGEQEALINIPIGLLLYSNNEEHTVQWVNPKLQNYFGKQDLIGKDLAAIDPQLEQLIQAKIKLRLLTIFVSSILTRQVFVLMFK